jgi:uncharacterized protein (TIGR03085 family)
MAADHASFSQRERWALCDLLSELGPDVPTLCAGWRSADLAAHLVTRDHRPDAVPGMVVRLGALTAWTDRVQQGLRDTLTWDALVARARSGPPPWLKPFDQGMNTVEYFVHHEDLRRAQPGWEPRSLPPTDEAVLWRHLRYMKLSPRPPASRLEAPGVEEMVLPRGRQRPVVRGPVGELALWLLGRKGVARVEVAS